MLCVAYNKEALSVHCVVERLKNTNSRVLLDIHRHHFTQEDFDHITQDRHAALDRIKEVDDYQHMIICTLRRLPSCALSQCVCAALDIFRYIF